MVGEPDAEFMCFTASKQLYGPAQSNVGGYLEHRGTGHPHYPLNKLDISLTKIITHKGDLSMPWLGLSEVNFWALASEVDLTLHMGAVCSFWDNYHLLRPSNGGLTKELIRMAGPRRILIHYVSTAGVVPEERARTGAASVAKHSPTADSSQGYAASRWASE